MVKKETINGDKLVKKTTVYADKKTSFTTERYFFIREKIKIKQKSKDCEHFNEID